MAVSCCLSCNTRKSSTNSTLTEPLEPLPTSQNFESISFAVIMSLDMNIPPYPYPQSLAAFVTLLILSEANRFYMGSAGFKILASLSFVGAGLQSATKKVDFTNLNQLLQQNQRPPALLVLGLVFSFVGDFLLIPSPATYYYKANKKSSPPPNEGETPRFKAGTLSFALAHIAYTMAFLSDTSYSQIRWPDFLLSLAFGGFLIHWLGVLQRPSSPGALFDVPDAMRGLVTVYIVIIMTMAATATATDTGYQKIVGAWTFMVSDIFVAANVFGVKKPGQDLDSGTRGWRSRSVGWVAYFGAQLLLAGCI